ncbi:MAG TPA: hypothetical protein VGR22_10295 [Thermomicrobiales bacterium]|nr:hypothetical protein [Thermomicrobiales bacterium]
MRQVVGFVIMLSCLLVLPAAPGTGQVPQATPGTSPVASQGSWRISGINAIAMDGRVAAMAPDGAMLAGVSADNIFCVWETTTLLASCADEELPIRLESIVWSPDGTAVVFSLDAVRMGYESDLYIYEVDAETLTNLTDDGVEGSIVSVPADTPIGDVPVWSPDSLQPAFTRSVRGEEAGSTMIMRIHRASGEPEAVLRLPLLEPFAIWLPMAWLRTVITTTRSYRSTCTTTATGFGGSPSRVGPAN